MYHLVEKPRLFRRAQDKNKLIVFFPSRPFWFVATPQYETLLMALDGSDSISDATNKMARSIQIDSGDLTPVEKSLNDAIQFLGQAGVLYKDGQPLIPVVDHEPSSQITEVESVLVLAFTYRCNLLCPHCYADAGGTPQFSEMSTEQVCQVISNLGDLPWDPHISNIGLIGGEPFVRRDIFDIMDFIRDEGYGILVSTNALLLDDDIVKKLARYPRLQVSVSLDGSHAETHEFIRGKGTFEKTVRAIRLLVSNGIDTGINVFIHRGNLSDLPDILHLAKDLGVGSVNANTLMLVGRGKQKLIEPVNRKELYRTMFETARSDSDIEALIENSTFANKLVALASGFKTKYCGVGSNRAVYVRADGNLYPCGDTCLPEFYLGNVTEDSIANIWENSPILEKLRQTDIDTLNDTCVDCDFRYYCGGDCRGENYQISGDFHSPHFKCKQIKAAIVDMMWMLAEEPKFLQEKMLRIRS